MRVVAVGLTYVSLTYVSLSRLTSGVQARHHVGHQVPMVAVGLT